MELTHFQGNYCLSR